MKNRLTARIEHQPSVQSRWFSKRSRSAGVLLSGWLFFWIVGIVQPCCIAMASADDSTMSQAMLAEGDAHLAGVAGGTSHPYDECPLVFTADTLLPSQGFSLPTSTDFTSQLVIASQIEQLLPVADFSNSLAVYHPSPPPRIYLRTQRLRI